MEKIHTSQKILEAGNAVFENFIIFSRAKQSDDQTNTFFWKKEKKKNYQDYLAVLSHGTDLVEPSQSNID